MRFLTGSGVGVFAIFRHVEQTGLAIRLAPVAKPLRKSHAESCNARMQSLWMHPLTGV